ncbi:SPFH domain-containing protein [Adlercreutzia sp. ZJ242]|uniref:SPFH domain-containing protein n=1 Tax=Adlercreutzia sp. ZJ242 TaxID=2709409 RepID=UPI0013ED609D|nr:SPFH domain-containing protein [Adlercreutzia sp. ZJ242]
MGFILAAANAVGGTFGDQWREYYSVPSGVSQTVGVCLAVPYGQNSNRNANVKGSQAVISDGSLIMVPEGFSLVTLENGQVTGYIAQPGAYRWISDNINSQSIFAGDDFMDSLVRQSWERFKFAGAPFASQVALFVNQKEIPNNRFGTQNTIYWDDPFFNTQVGAIARGTYTIRIEDPILFVKNYLPVDAYIATGEPFDFGDFFNPVNEQLFNEVAGSLSASFSQYANSPDHSGRIMDIQGDALGFASSLSHVVEKNYSWLADRGLRIVKAAISSLDYDASSKELMAKIRQADALMGARGNSNLQASFAEGLANAGNNPDGGGLGMAFMGMAMQTGGYAVGNMQQPMNQQQSPYAQQQNMQTQNQPASDPYGHLNKLKRLLDDGVITQEEFDAVKKKTLGI